MPTDELAERDGNGHAQRVAPLPPLRVWSKGRCTLDADRQAARPKRSGHGAMEHLTVSQCTPPHVEAREHVQPGCLLMAAGCMAGLLNRARSLTGTQTPPEGLAPKACLHDLEDHMPLALYERHGSLFLGVCEMDVSSLCNTTSLLTEVPAKALAMVSVEQPDNFRLDM